MWTTIRIKWNDRKTATVPKVFAAAYPEATFRGVTPKNYDEFLFP